jgi:MoaA/NifB/PqqE/SkfB family radical SAM enzyme
MSGSDTVTVMGNPEGQPSARARAGSFCVHLWQHMRLDAGGQARVCCAYRGDSITQDGVPVSTDRQSLMEIWNADTMRELRRDMAADRRNAGCKECYTVEARGGVSIRVGDNHAWEQDWFDEQRPTIDAMIAQAVDNEFRLPTLPEMIEIEVGNLCNLKCRMCNSYSSSRIARDPVQRNWDALQSIRYDDPEIAINPGKIRRAGPIARLVDELAGDAGGQVKVLYFLGGEPFLIREIPELLERLVVAGRARHINLLFVSNGSIMPEWLSMATQFRRVDLAISVDGYADHYDYIRYPGRWSKLAQNFQMFRKIPNLYTKVTTTIQVNNALNLTQLFRYLDSVEIGFTGYLLLNPPHLAVSALPSSIRRLAAARLTAYAQDDCRPEHRALVQSLAAQFEACEESVAPDVLRDFMRFTNDLDASRGQSIHRTDPELVALLEHAGFPWLDETLHVSADRAAHATQSRRHAPMQAQTAASRLHRDLGDAIRLLRGSLVDQRDETGQTHGELKHVHAELSQARAELNLAHDDLHNAREKLRQAHDELSQTRNAQSTSEQKAARLDLQLARLYASRSWRVMRPLRAAARLIREWLPGIRSPDEPDAY